MIPFLRIAQEPEPGTIATSDGETISKIDKGLALCTMHSDDSGNVRQNIAANIARYVLQEGVQYGGPQYSHDGSMDRLKSCFWFSSCDDERN